MVLGSIFVFRFPWNVLQPREWLRFNLGFHMLTLGYGLPSLASLDPGETAIMNTSVKEINHRCSWRSYLDITECFNFLLGSWDIMTNNQNNLFISFCSIRAIHIQRQWAAGLPFPSFPFNEISNLDISFHTCFVSLQVMWCSSHAHIPKCKHLGTYWLFLHNIFWVLI